MWRRDADDVQGGQQVVTANTVEELSRLLAAPAQDVFYDSVTPASCTGSLADSEVLEAVVQYENEIREGQRMELEEEHGRRFRDWQSWMDRVQQLPRDDEVLEVSIRARVRHRGVAGRAQALRFSIFAGDTIEVAVAVDRFD